MDEKVPVNFVFVGYERDDVDADKFLAGLPDRYKPIVRSRYFYNESIGKSLLGLHYTYDYNVKFAPATTRRSSSGSCRGRRSPRPSRTIRSCTTATRASSATHQGIPNPARKGAS
ncbi:MAG TPA: hypothetical protein VIZ60_10185 [Rubrobacter sp.]